MRHIFAVSNSDTNMQEAKSMQKYDETALNGRCVTTLVADIHVVMGKTDSKRNALSLHRGFIPKNRLLVLMILERPC
jgi:hypothetical protein